MRVALFIPCYIDQLYPRVGIATLQLLTNQGFDVHCPPHLCCGQPLANSGYEDLTSPYKHSFESSFAGCDYIVVPSGSCALHLKEHLLGFDHPLSGKVFELCEFLSDISPLRTSPAFAHKVAIHNSCHGLRGLHLAQMSELSGQYHSKPETLLKKVKHLELVEFQRQDDCCGFGGTFCVMEEAVSVRMGQDRVEDVEGRVEYITSADMSCLMHLEGVIKKGNRNIKVIHIAEILNHGE